MSLYKSIHLMKKVESWSIDEILDMPPLDWNIFRQLTLADLQ